MNTQNKNTIELNGKQLIVDDSLFDFSIIQKPSSNVDYFGLDYVSERLFIQFKGGSGAYIYYGVNMDVLDAAKNAESIGKFVSSTIVGKFVSNKSDIRLVTPVEQ
jgi:hypothetical protein